MNDKCVKEEEEEKWKEPVVTWEIVNGERVMHVDHGDMDSTDQDYEDFVDYID